MDNDDGVIAFLIGLCFEIIIFLVDIVVEVIKLGCILLIFIVDLTIGWGPDE